LNKKSFFLSIFFFTVESKIEILLVKNEKYFETHNFRCSEEKQPYSLKKLYQEITCGIFINKLSKIFKFKGKAFFNKKTQNKNFYMKRAQSIFISLIY